MTKHSDIKGDEMKWHKKYRDQFRECFKTGNRFRLQDILVCIPYKTFCDSKVCHEKRLQPDIKLDAQDHCGL